jgi:nitrogen fixation NifU-like protein
MNHQDLPILGQGSSEAVEHSDAPKNYGQPSFFNGHARITGPCGDTMEFWLEIEHAHVTGIGFTTTGCGSSRAAGSMATELAVGRHIEDAVHIEQADILEALGGLPSDSEHCALLAANTLKAALEDFKRFAGQDNHMDLE